MPRKPYIARPSYSHATGEIRKGVKPVLTEARYMHKVRYWARVQTLLRYWLETQGSGAQARIAADLGLTDSQIHRFSCPVCEHDQEPSFSVGMAILCYITEHLFHGRDGIVAPPKKSHKKRK
jgi:hypothetical protein